MYDIKRYFEAHTVEEAISLLNEHADARLIAGGSDMLIKIREGKMAGTSLVSLRNIPELNGIAMSENGDIEIGACTPFSHITANAIIRENIPLLGEAVDKVGGPQVRNIGTIGGNICNGAVSADSVPSCFSFEALLRIAHLSGVKIVPIQEFYLGPGKTALNQNEVLTRVIIPAQNYLGYTGEYIKYAMREAMDIATLSCAIVCKTDKEKNILSDARITFGVAAPVPFRCRETEAKLIGQPINEELFDLIENGVREEINPRDSWRASRKFRLQIGGEIARRALISAIQKQGA